MICSIDSCQRRSVARGICDTHYAYLKRHDNLPPKAPPVVANRKLTPQLCGCGCGEYAAVDPRRNRVAKFVSGHNAKIDPPAKGLRHTEETKAKIRAARKRQTNIPIAGPHAPAEERFMGMVHLQPNNGCWEWQGAKPRGYGAFGVGSTRDRSQRVVRAHRYAYEFFVGAIPDGLEIDHLCNNKGCVNPDHLEPVTHAENLRRAGSRRQEKE